MAKLSDVIESFIKELLAQSEDGVLELQRNEMAEYFNCAPSQINYVLATRFTVERGYYIESKRGGGGCVRIIRLNVDKDDYILNLLNHVIGSAISQYSAENIIHQLNESGSIDDKQAMLMKAAINDKAITIPASIRDVVRANVLKSMLMTLLSF